MRETSPRVLVVDDDEIIRDVLADALGDAGYEVRLAADGREALTVLEDWRPDVIVLDLMMPRMDGWAFRAAQRALPAAADVPVVILSAAHEVAARTASLDPVAVLDKPFELDTLLATLRAVTRPPR